MLLSYITKVYDAMHFFLKNVPLCLVVLFLLKTGNFAADGHVESPSFFWEKEIDAAIVERNNAFSFFIPDSAGIDILSLSDRHTTAVLHTISDNPVMFPIWNNFIHGVLLQRNQHASAADYFQYSLSSAKGDPGSTWLLFVEFNRYNLTSYGEKALVQLEQQMFTAGTTTAQIIARHLLQLGIEQKMLKENKRAALLFGWAHRFDKNETASLFQSIMIALPFNFRELQNAFHLLFVTLSSSWVAQLSCFAAVHSFIHIFFTLFVVFITAIFCGKYFPKALHALAHRYPEGVANRLRTFLVSCCILSLICFGCIPFFWFVTFLIWRFLSKNEIIWYSIALVIVTCSPLDAIITNRFQIALHPENTLMLLAKSLHEGNTDTATLDSIPGDSDKNRERILRVATLAASIRHYDPEQSRSVHLAIASIPSGDPVADNLKGIVYFFEGAIDSAHFYFKKVLTYHKNDIYARFNLSRCSVVSNDATNGIEQLKQAASINPSMINTFIQSNDNYFSNNWPLMRQVMFPDYAPSYFWSTLFLPVTATTSSSDRLQWGLAFVGFPPVFSFYLFIVLSLCLTGYTFRLNAHRKVRHIFECKYCGKTICRNCTTGILCQSCSHATHNLRTGMTLEQTRNDIIGYSSAIREILKAVLNLFVPGSGMVVGLQLHYWKAFMLLGISCFIYSWWVLVLGNLSPRWMITQEFVFFLLLPIFFHGFALFRFLPIIIRQGQALIAATFSRGGN